jgi:hypothetical protein
MTVFCHRNTNVRRKPVTTKCGQRRLQNGREDNEAYRGGNKGEFEERDAGAKKKKSWTNIPVTLHLVSNLLP